MYKIAVCDDDAREGKKTYDLVQQWLDTSEVDGSVTLFEGSVRLLEAVHSGEKFNLYVLDILMPEINGIETGKTLVSRDNQAQIIYTTSYKEFAYSAYENKALQYLLKPIQRGDLFDALGRARMIYQALGSGRKVLIKGKDGSTTVNENEILYIENIQRAPAYHLLSGDTIMGLVNRGTFDEAVDPIPTFSAFTSPHKSYWVNMRYIRQIGTENMKLMGGVEIPISRKKINSLKMEYLKFLSEEGKE